MVSRYRGTPQTWRLCVAGCFGNDKCEVGSGYCKGEAAFVCEPPCSELGCHAHYIEHRCFAACVEDRGTALCAISKDKDPRCIAGIDSYCDGSSVTSCDRGYVVATSDCAETDEACVETGGGRAICAISSARDPRCSSSPQLTHQCDALHKLTCQSGFLVVDETCAIACAEEDNRAECSLVEGPDPLCAAGAPASDGDLHCRDDRLFRCAGRISVLGAECDAGEGICVEDALFGTRCEFPLDPAEAEAARGDDPNASEPPREPSTPQPDPRCPSDRLFAAVCDGRTWLGCQDGRRTAERECAHDCAEVIDDLGEISGWCALSTGPDRRCAPDQPERTRSTLGCAGDSLFFCSSDRALEDYDCRDYGYVCVPARAGHSAYCAAPAAD
jgi:hypothetical protein